MAANSTAVAVTRDYLVHVPEPKLILWELPFWAALLYCAIMPGSVAPWWTLAGLPIRSAEGVILLAAIWFASGALLQGLAAKQRRLPGLFVPFFASLAWALLSTGWNSLEDENQGAMRLTIALALAAGLTAWGVLANYSREETHHFLWRLTAFLSALSLLYAAESIFSLGLRSDLGQNTLLDFGIERVKGPLYGSSTGYLILLPALAFAIHHAINIRQRRMFAVVMVLALLTAMLGLGSRAALLLLGVYLAMLSFLIRSVRKRLLALTLTISLSALAAVVIFSQASTDRLQSFEDDSRRATHATALRSVEQQSWAELVRGSGYGAVWNWYLTDARNGDRLSMGDNVIRTPAGLTLYHSHSTFLAMAMELGLPGLVAFGGILAALAGLVKRCWHLAAWQPFACGVAASGLGLFFDLFLFKNTSVNLVWWLYAIGAAQLMRQPEE